MRLSRQACAVLIALAPISWIAAPSAIARVTPASDARPDDVAMDFARAYLDPAVYVVRFRAALRAGVATCVTSKKMTADQALEKNAFYDKYMGAWESEFPDMQGKIAAAMRGSFDDVQLTELDTFYRSPTGRKLTAVMVDQLVDMLAKSSPACGSALPTIDKAQLASTAASRLSSIELEELAAFGASDTGHKFHDFQPSLMAVFGPLIRASKVKALEAAGLKKEAS